MGPLSLTSSPSSAPTLSGAELLGRTEPRLWTPPLRELTPETSYGFDVVKFADRTLHHPLDPWEEFAVIHAGELLPDGRPRFRIVLILVARQNGKTEVLVVLTLYWQFVDAVPLILGTSTKLDYAKESWKKAIKLAERTRAFDALRPPRWKREANGEQESWTREDARYKISPANEEGGRSLTIHRLVCDELRQHHSYAAWDAAEPAASPDDAQIFALSNAGDERSVVLNDLRAAALQFIETGEGDPRLGLFEWSAPLGSDPEDAAALAMANPNMGRRGTDLATLQAIGRRAKARGGEALTGFLTERMCIHVPNADPAIDAAAWRDCPKPADLAEVRERRAMVVDAAPDLQHVALYAATEAADGRVRVDPVAAWTGVDAVDQAARAIPGEVAKVQPAALGWLPNSPTAALAAKLAERKGRTGWPPRGVKIEEIRAETPAVCMGFAALVAALQIAHPNDPLLNAQVEAAEKLYRGDVWVFSRRGGGHVNAVYAAAGAVHLARTLPPPQPPLVVLTVQR